MEREMNFIIKKGIDCSWCVGLMKKTLMQHFAIKEIEVDVLNKKAHVVLLKEIKPENLILYLKKRGYHLVEEK